MGRGENHSAKPLCVCEMYEPVHLPAGAASWPDSATENGQPVRGQFSPWGKRATPGNEQCQAINPETTQAQVAESLWAQGPGQGSIMVLETWAESVL